MEEELPKPENSATDLVEGQAPSTEDMLNEGMGVPEPKAQPDAVNAPVEESATGMDVASKESAEQHKLFGVVGYVVPFLFFIPLLTEAKDNEFAKYHANQQLLLLLFWVIGQTVASLLVVVLIGALLLPVIGIVGIIFTVMGVINVLNGEMKPLPVIGKFKLIK